MKDNPYGPFDEEDDEARTCVICGYEDCDQHSWEDQAEYKYLKLMGRNK